MDRKVRNLIILVAVLGGLILGYVVVMLVTPEQVDTLDDSESPAVTLFRITEDGLTALSYTYDSNADGQPELWSYTRDEDWHWSEDATVPLGVSAFETVKQTLSEATGTLLATNPTTEQLAAYGLDNPVKEVAFTDVAGGKQSFSLGVYNAYNGTYCATVNGNTAAVYMVDATLFTTFDLAIETMVYVDDLPTCKSDKLVSVTFSTAEHTVTVTHESVEVDGMEALGWFRTVDGGTSVRVSDTIAERIDTLLGDMDYLACYSVRTADFPTYGLDAHTTTMTVVYQKTVSGTLTDVTFTLTLGATNDYNYYYVNPTGTSVTMLLGGDVWYKLITYDDLAISTDPTEDTAV